MFAQPAVAAAAHQIARYIAPYDAAVRPDSLARRSAWITPPKPSTSRCWSPSTTPSTRPRSCRASRSYQHDVQKFVKLFPHVKQYQSWDEANRGNVAARLLEPLGRRGGRSTTRR